MNVNLLDIHQLTTKNTELYPKQNSLQSGQTDSLVRLPFGRHQALSLLIRANSQERNCIHITVYETTWATC